jgi:hypothetical protein
VIASHAFNMLAEPKVAVLQSVCAVTSPIGSLCTEHSSFTGTAAATVEQLFGRFLMRRRYRF